LRRPLLVRAALPQWPAFLDGFCGPRVPLGFYVPRPLRAARARAGARARV